MIWRNYHRQQARKTAEKWQGLQHIDRQTVEGLGIDCIGLVLEVIFDAGLLDRRPVPKYPTTWGLASPDNIMAAAMAQAMHCSRIPIADWQPAFGDVVIWKAGRQSNHVGIVIDDQVWHVLRGGRVGPAAIGPVKRRAQEAVRLTGKGWRMDPTKINMRNLRS